jgi:mono/diheme cytochrome c family protein
MCAMQIMRFGMCLVAMLAALYTVEMPRGQSTAAPTTALSTKLRAQRSSPVDLELNGGLAGVPRGESRFLTREDLLAVSHPMAYGAEDGGFFIRTQIIGMPLDDLARSLGVPASDMVIAICKDNYRAHYSRRYLAAHLAVLVLEIHGISLADRSKHSPGDDMGPYLIVHLNFKPAFKVLAHEDEPQIPWGVIRLEFRSEKTVLGTIAPRGPHASDTAVQDGFKIAQQNCFHCHNNGAEGGLKSGVTWTVLGAMATNSPEFFTEYVRDPKAKNPKTQMAAKPEYDDATMRALIRYFRTFAPAEAR